eukprot:1051415-Amphidinium_carterae.1
MDHWVVANQQYCRPFAGWANWLFWLTRTHAQMRTARPSKVVMVGFLEPGKGTFSIPRDLMSRGECWASDILRFKLGEVVGCRSWGGVVEVALHPTVELYMCRE